MRTSNQDAGRACHKPKRPWMLVVFTSLGGGSVVPSDARCRRGSSRWSRNQLPSFELMSLMTHQAARRQRRAQRHCASAATGVVADAQTNA